MVMTAQKQRPKLARAGDTPPITLRLSPLIELTEEQFAEFCGLNDDLRIERNADGELEIMSPTKGIADNRNVKIITQLEIWTSSDGSGMAFGSSMGYTLPNGAMRSPDASWVPNSLLAELAPADFNRFIPICPDFVVELRSDTDRLAALQSKMEEYMDNGALLGWLIDPSQRRVYIYQPNQRTHVLDDPQSVSADPVLPGFTLDLTEVWDPWHSLSSKNSE